MSYEQQLLAMRKQLLKKKPIESVETPIVPQRIASPSYEKQWLQAGLSKVETEQGVVYEKVTTYGIGAKHGQIEFKRFLNVLETWKNRSEKHPLKPLHETMVFFDTETTGLAGAGALIFLLGFLTIEEERVIVRQLVLPSPDHEPLFLAQTPFTQEPLTIFSYNGKSFDFPMLASRFAMHRDQLPQLNSAHQQIDLLHSSRRIWKKEQGQFSLTAMEKEWLGFYRQDDIPGYLAPIIYEEAVKTGDASTLMRVLKHNEWDLLSLVTLYAKSVELMMEDWTLSSVTIQQNLAKWFDELKWTEESASRYASIIAAYGKDSLEAHYYFAKILKRDGHYEEAMRHFQQAIGLKGRLGVLASEQCAMIAEHQQKNNVLALRYTFKAHEILNEDHPQISTRFKHSMARQLQKRKMRLEKRHKDRSST